MTDKSIADLLRESVANATDPEPLEIQLPVFDPPLVMSLVRIKDAREREAAMAGLDKIRDEADRGLEALARMLVLACEYTTVELGGQHHQLPPIGVALYNYIYPEGPAAVNPDLPPPPAPTSDVEAVMALYTDAVGQTDTVALVDAATEYAEWSRTAALKAHQVVLGESAPE